MLKEEMARHKNLDGLVKKCLIFSVYKFDDKV